MTSTNKATLVASDYVHLHNHTHYSVLDGLQKIPEMLDYVKELGMESIAITDHGSLSGAIEFYKEAKSRGIKPIIGLETYIASRKHTNKDPAKDKGRFHLILLAMNMQGYQNLMKLSTVANLEGFYHKPRIDHDLIEQYHEGLIALSGCIGGEVGENLRYGDYEKAKEIALWYKGIFGDRYYLEVQHHGTQWDEQKRVNDLLFKLGKELDIPLVLTCDAHYLKHEDQEAHEILLCVQTGAFLSEADRFSLKGTDLHVTEPDELIKAWGDTPEIITNTKVIADRCELELELGKILIPKFEVPKGETEKSYLHKHVFQGLAWRYADIEYADSKNLSIEEARKIIPAEQLTRADYELGVIDNMGFNGYFLIIWDFIGWGKDQGIIFGPGRGSAAGSIVAYSLRITELDPLKYDLLFERFLNPDRISMPDIDIDIQDSRRDEVIQYCVEKYGTHRVANIVTFGKMAARNAIRDVARVLQVPYADADRMAKLVPPPVQGRHIPLKKSLVENQDLKAEYEKNPAARQVYDMATRLEGTIRSHGVHAAGVVIAPDDIVKFAPLEMAQKGVVTTQYSMGPIEDLGLLKMDFLGLSNLTTIKNALRIVKRVYGQDIDIEKVPLTDKATFELLSRGDTTGVFQLESAGMKRYLKELKPTVFDDIVAMVALYRPGPMQWIDDFISRKHGKKSITYVDKAMEPALKNTYGVLVYQEQVMQISKEMCGFTGGQADTLRKAIGKKQVEVMLKLKKDFIDGAVEVSGADRADMEAFWINLEDFAAYCFNKSHAACYALIAYWTAYLKANYPAAFMAAVMTSDYDDTDRLAIEIAECKHMGITVLPPSVNESFHEFAVVPHAKDEPAQIRFGMDAIKNVGHGAVAEILRARDEDGKFKDIGNFITRVNARLVNRKVWESLIKAGAYDEFSERGALLESLDPILAVGAKLAKEMKTGQTDLFGNDDSVAAPALNLQITEGSGQFNDHDFLLWERELLGLYLSKHPLEAFQSILDEKSVPLRDITAINDGKVATVGGTISEIRTIMTKNGQPMAFVKLEDFAGDEREIVVFPNAFKDYEGAWIRDKIVLVTGKVNGIDRDGTQMPEAKILADTVEILTVEEAKSYESTGKRTVLKNGGRGRRGAPGAVPNKQASPSPSVTPQASRLYVRVPDEGANEELQKIKKVLDGYRGDYEAVLVMGGSKQIIKLPLTVGNSAEMLAELSGIIGKEHVKFQ